MPAWLTTLLPVITLVLGAVLSQVADRSRDARQLATVRAARAADRELERLQRRESFELQHLTDLHAALSGLLRAISRIHHADTLAHRETGAYAGRLLPDDVSDQHLAANQAVTALKELVLDAYLRDLVTEAHRCADTFAGLTNSTAERGQRLAKVAVDTIVEAQAAVAARIREIYIDAG